MPSILDAYSGCGGFSLGAHQAGFETALAIDSDPILTSSFGLNFPQVRLLREDIRNVDSQVLKELLPHGADGVVGGPPCQAFSEIGRRDTADPRRDLVGEFFRIVRLVKPKFFVFENVPGLGFGANVGLLQSALDRLPSAWKTIGPLTLNAADFGAPTRRLRLFVFGFNGDEMDVPDVKYLTSKSGSAISVRDAIWDVVSASPAGVDDRGFDLWKYDGRRSASEYALQMRTADGYFTGHRKTIHLKSTQKRFSALAEGESDKVGKYTRLSWNGHCPTLRAGTGQDRGSYQAVRPIHPSQHRVITPREAARLQGFPDRFLFHPTIWHSCRMIGNSVSPIIARVLFERIGRVLGWSSGQSIPIAAE